MSWISLFVAVVFLFQAPQRQASISGYVVKMGTGEPVGKALVTLSSIGSGRNQSFTATTNSTGQFAFQNLEPGQYRLMAARNGYVRMEYGARSPNRPGLLITLSLGQQLPDIVVQLMPAGTITGRVFDRDGEPFANVTVEALRYSYQEGQRVLNGVQSARTNDLGEYRLFWLQPGQYFISATPQAQRGGVLNSLSVAGPEIAGAIGDIANRDGARGARGRGGQQGPEGQRGTQAPPPIAIEPQSQGQSAEAYIPVYYPGTTDAQSAAPISLPAGIVFSGVDLTVVAARTLRVQGQVINGATGQAAQNTNVILLPVQRQSGGGALWSGIRNAGNLRSRINNQGIFEIRSVVPGSYELIAVLNDRNNRLTARLPLEVGNADVQNVSLVLTPGFTLNGRLTVEGVQAGAGNQDLARIRVMLRSDSTVDFGGSAASATVQADGTFTLQQVGRDEYHLRVSGMPRNGYVKSARYGAVDLMDEGLRLDRQPTSPLEIFVATDTGSADGNVQSDKQEPSVNVTVVFVPDGARRHRLDLYRTASTDAMGHLHVEGVPPGDYRVFAWEDVENGAWQDPDFVRRFEDQGKSVRINENSRTRVELRVIPSGG